MVPKNLISADLKLIIHMILCFVLVDSVFSCISSQNLILPIAGITAMGKDFEEIVEDVCIFYPNLATVGKVPAMKNGTEFLR